MYIFTLMTAHSRAPLCYHGIRTSHRSCRRKIRLSSRSRCRQSCLSRCLSRCGQRCLRHLQRSGPGSRPVVRSDVFGRPGNRRLLPEVFEAREVGSRLATADACAHQLCVCVINKSLVNLHLRTLKKKTCISLVKRSRRLGDKSTTGQLQPGSLQYMSIFDPFSRKRQVVATYYRCIATHTCT